MCDACLFWACHQVTVVPAIRDFSPVGDRRLRVFGAAFLYFLKNVKKVGFMLLFGSRKAYKRRFLCYFSLLRKVNKRDVLRSFCFCKKNQKAAARVATLPTSGERFKTRAVGV